jgi:hypothetical protein
VAQLRIRLSGALTDHGQHLVRLIDHRFTPGVMAAGAVATASPEDVPTLSAQQPTR